MRGDAGVKAAYDAIEDLFLRTHVLEVALPSKAILLIDERPDVRSVVVSESFQIAVDIKVFAQVVFFVLHMPHPFRVPLPFFLPVVGLSFFADDLVRRRPETGYLLLVASADSAAFGLADPIHESKRALLLEVEANETEVFGLNERLENVIGFVVDFM